ncbi:MAG: hypothetical protein WA364_07225 [Candidatus Nitrosopolaris sp.]
MGPIVGPDADNKEFRMLQNVNMKSDTDGFVNMKSDTDYTQMITVTCRRTMTFLYAG